MDRLEQAVSGNVFKIREELRQMAIKEQSQTNSKKNSPVNTLSQNYFKITPKTKNGFTKPTNPQKKISL